MAQSAVRCLAFSTQQIKAHPTMSIYGKKLTYIVPPLFSGISHEFHNCKQLLASSQGSFRSSLILSFQCTCNVIPTDLLSFMGRRKHHQAGVSGYNAPHITERVSLLYSYTVCSCKMRIGWMLGTGRGQRWTTSDTPHPWSSDANCQPTPFRYCNSGFWTTEASSVWGSLGFRGVFDLTEAA